MTSDKRENPAACAPHGDGDPDETILISGGELTIQGRFRTEAEFDAFIARANGVSAVLWPPQQPEPKKRKSRKGGIHALREVQPGTATAAIFEAAKKFGVGARKEIADATGFKRGLVGMTITRLQKGGLL